MRLKLTSPVAPLPLLLALLIIVHTAAHTLLAGGRFLQVTPSGDPVLRAAPICTRHLVSTRAACASLCWREPGCVVFGVGREHSSNQHHSFVFPCLLAGPDLPLCDQHIVLPDLEPTYRFYISSERTIDVALETTMTTREVTVPVTTLAPPVCGSLLHYTPSPAPPAGWTMCYSDIADGYASTLCSDLLVAPDLGGYADSTALLAAGGNFGCWKSSSGTAGINPSLACKNDYQQTTTMDSCAACTVLGVCVYYP